LEGWRHPCDPAIRLRAVALRRTRDTPFPRPLGLGSGHPRPCYGILQRRIWRGSIDFARKKLRGRRTIRPLVLVPDWVFASVSFVNWVRRRPAVRLVDCDVGSTLRLSLTRPHIWRIRVLNETDADLEF
jgi:hypothetical protein